MGRHENESGTSTSEPAESCESNGTEWNRMEWSFGVWRCDTRDVRWLLPASLPFCFETKVVVVAFELTPPSFHWFGQPPLIGTAPGGRRGLPLCIAIALT